jgi:regulator of nonsense transcripts 1
MEGAFTHLGNHLVSDSASTINAGADDESILEGGFGRLPRGTRRRQDDEDFDDDDDLESVTESMASMAVDGVNGKKAQKEEDIELPSHACA